MNKKNNTRREFLKKSALFSTALFFSINPTNSFSFQKNSNIKSRGYAAFDETGILKPWSFERREVGENDILIEIKYASICHSDIHQIRGDWGKQQYPQVPGHEIVGIVKAIGKKVKKFKVGNRVGVGCMVDGSCKKNEQYCEDTLFTYGFTNSKEPTGITQGGYSTNIVVNSHFAVHIPKNISLEKAAPLLCAGVTIYSPFMKDNIKKGTKVGVAGIGGLGHLAVKLAVSKGATVYAFTTSKDKVKDILDFGAKEVIVVDNIEVLSKYKKKVDYMISTIPEVFDISAYCNVVKPNGTFVQVGLPKGLELPINSFEMALNRVNFKSSFIGSIKQTQEVVNYCSKNKVLPKIQIIKAEQINEAWQKVLDKKARFRYVIDASTF